MGFCKVAIFVAVLLGIANTSSGAEKDVIRVAAIVTVYTHNSHADVIVSRLFQGYELNDTGEYPRMKLVSLYTDQVPVGDKSRAFAAKYGFPIYSTVAECLTLGTGKLAVDGVLLICEHGDYPESATGSIMHPKRRLFTEILHVFESSQRVVPVFTDKHLSDNWTDAKWMYDQAARLKIPMMAGSSLPTLWRYPPMDVARGKKLQELLAISYHRLDAYGFHALEMAQCLVERRAGGETGVAAVECLSGQAVWQAGKEGRFDRSLLDAALRTLKRPPMTTGKSLEELVPEPDLFLIDYRDGLRVRVLTLNPAVGEFAAAWRYENKEVGATLFWTQESRPFMHFSYLVQGIDRMFHTDKPTWPVERTLLTSGLLDTLLTSRLQGGKRIDTPFLQFPYQSDFDWQQPPPPPAARPLDSQ